MIYSREMLNSYIETALWSSVDDNGQPLDNNYDINDLSFSALRQAANELRDFCETAGELLNDCSPTRVAHDFWLTRNSHGAGFWDGDYSKEIGKALTRISKDMLCVDLYVGDDGKIDC